MKWQNRIYENILEHQFKRGGSSKGRSPRQMTTGNIKTTVIKDLKSSHSLRKKGKNPKALDKRISGFVKELQSTRGLSDTSR